MSTSEKRIRKKVLPTRWTDSEYEALTRRAEAVGLSRAGYIRLKAIGEEGPRTQRAKRHGTADLARLLAAVNKIGGNVNQVARAINQGYDPYGEIYSETILRAIREVQDLVRAELDRR